MTASARPAKTAKTKADVPVSVEIPSDIHLAELATKSAAELPFDVAEFLATAGLGKSIASYAKDETIYSQGDPADSVYYVQKGKVKISVVSSEGKEATISL